jgi:hypothetical protein
MGAGTSDLTFAAGPTTQVEPAGSRLTVGVHGPLTASIAQKSQAHEWA